MTSAELAQARLDALAARLEPRLRAAFLAAVAALGAADAAELVRRLTSGSPEEVAGWLMAQPAVTAALAAVRGLYAEGVVRLAASEAASLSATLRIRVAAPVVSPPLIEAVRRWENGAFARVKLDVQGGLRDIVAEELTRGVGPRQVAVRLKAGVAGGGLTPYDLKIIRSFRAALEEGRFRDALGRTLRDLRSDRTLERLLRDGGTLTPAQIEKMVQAYQRKLAAWRAETFARTNAIQAVNEATKASWRAAIEQGTVPATELRQFWVVARDERLCPICAPVPDLNRDGIELDGEFITPLGAVPSPPLHPNCRCVTFIRHVRPGVRQRPAPGQDVLLLPA
ncbi:MAG: phage head morphogenesis protein [Gemmatimonadaceae bacterium]|nr:phage head morphogenesis protein [Gemmatimonadaceae bacterium]